MSRLSIFLKAVDYPKQGIAPDLEGGRLPRTLIRCNPHWHQAEVVSPSTKTDYYESSRALGYLVRSIQLPVNDPKPTPPVDLQLSDAICDPISVALLAWVQFYLQESAFLENYASWVVKLFRIYCDELWYICVTHTISKNRLSEAEVVIGTILATCAQKR